MSSNCDHVKDLIARKYSNAVLVSAALTMIESKPDDAARRQMLEDELKTAKVDQDGDVLKQAQALVPFQAAPGKALVDTILEDWIEPKVRNTLVCEGHVDGIILVVFVASDELAIGALRAVRSLGIRVPQDVAIMGFDDVPIAQRVTPSLTTVRLPIRELGVEAAEIRVRPKCTLTRGANNNESGRRD